MKGKKRRIAVLACLVGCGRFGFDGGSTSDTIVDAEVSEPADSKVIGHDEDSDGIGDDGDVCPHIADDQRDSDGDGVGDACDSFAGVRNRLRFYSLVTGTPDPAVSIVPRLDQLPSAWSKGNDSWTLMSDGSTATNLHIAGPTQNGEAFVGGDIVGALGTGNHEIGIRFEGLPIGGIAEFRYCHYFVQDLVNSASFSCGQRLMSGQIVNINNTSTNRPFLAQSKFALRASSLNATDRVAATLELDTGQFVVGGVDSIPKDFPHYHIEFSGGTFVIRYFAIVEPAP